MKPYRPRKIQYSECYHLGAWTVKIYTIAKEDHYMAQAHYETAKQQLPVWLALKNGFNDDHHHCAFLIVHQGKEGVFAIVNWWVDEEMLNTHVFLSDIKEPANFQRISGGGLAPCIWELEVINYERSAWMKYVLQPDVPDFERYWKDQYNGII